MLATVEHDRLRTAAASASSWSAWTTCTRAWSRCRGAACRRTSCRQSRSAKLHEQLARRWRLRYATQVRADAQRTAPPPELPRPQPRGAAHISRSATAAAAARPVSVLGTLARACAPSRSAPWSLSPRAVRLRRRRRHRRRDDAGNGSGRIEHGGSAGSAAGGAAGTAGGAGEATGGAAGTAGSATGGAAGSSGASAGSGGSTAGSGGAAAGSGGSTAGSGGSTAGSAAPAAPRRALAAPLQAPAARPPARVAPLRRRRRRSRDGDLRDAPEAAHVHLSDREAVHGDRDVDVRGHRARSLREHQGDDRRAEGEGKNGRLLLQRHVRGVAPRLHGAHERGRQGGARRVQAGPLDNWPGEQWVDLHGFSPTSPSDAHKLLRKIMGDRVLLAKDKGCDAVDFDNVNEQENAVKQGRPGHHRARPAGVQHVARRPGPRLVDEGVPQEQSLANRRRRELPGRQGPRRIFDGAINEQCFEFDECDQMMPFRNLAKPIFVIQYKPGRSRRPRRRPRPTRCTSTSRTTRRTR